MGPDPPVSYFQSEGALKYLITKALFRSLALKFRTGRMFIHEYFTFSSHDLRYISVSLIRKS